MTADSPLPLAGVRVLAVEQYGAGPFGTMFLADQGAEVIKIEPPEGGDFAREIGPHFFSDGSSQFFHAFNRNKRSLTLDLTQARGVEVFRRLVRSSDAVASNLRGDVPEKLGLTYDALSSENNKIVCAHLSAYGRQGSRKNWPGFDYLMQAEAGWFSLTGEPENPPTRFGLSVVDQMTGLALAYAVLAGVTGARSTGVGRDMDVSLFDIALTNLGYPAMWYLNTGHVQTRLPRSAHPSLTPCALYTTKDGWIYLMCNKEKFWPALCDALGHPEWIVDPRFKSFKERLENRALVEDVLDSALSAKTTSQWLEEFASKVPAAPINDVGEALENPFVRDEGRIQNLEIEGHETYRYVAPPVKASGAEPQANPAPNLGADTRSILSGVGLSEAEINALKEDGVI